MGIDPIFDCDLEDFDEKVIAASHSGPIMVDFWADWCAPCHAIAPQLQQVIQHRSDTLRLAKVEVDEGENMKLAGRYRLRGFPTLILFNDGIEVERFSGAQDSQWIDAWLDRYLA